MFFPLFSSDEGKVYTMSLAMRTFVLVVDLISDQIISILICTVNDQLYLIIDHSYKNQMIKRTMDALSDILRSIRLSSSVYFRSDFASPWGMEMDRSPYAQFHIVVRGQCWLFTDTQETPLALSGGDIVIFPLGDAHWIADHPDHARLPGPQVLEAIRQHRAPFGEGPTSTTLVCGHFELDRDLDHPFIQALPHLIYIRGRGQHQLTWLETATNVIIQETDSGRPGAEVVVNRLAEVLFIQALRTYMEQSNLTQGYFAALKDPFINQALRLIHAQPEAPWKLATLARRVGLSRSAFANRFKALVGLPVLRYLTDWRMYKARQLLQRTGLSQLDIAEQVGYSSEAAFNRAFKRKYSQTPGAIRKVLAAR